MFEFSNRKRLLLSEIKKAYEIYHMPFMLFAETNIISGKNSIASSLKSSNRWGSNFKIFVDIEANT